MRGMSKMLKRSLTEILALLVGGPTTPTNINIDEA